MSCLPIIRRSYSDHRLGDVTLLPSMAHRAIVTLSNENVAFNERDVAHNSSDFNAVDYAIRGPCVSKRNS